jgi:hypothetical protein
MVSIWGERFDFVHWVIGNFVTLPVYGFENANHLEHMRQGP